METYKIGFGAMGGACELHLGAESERSAKSLAERAIAEVQRIEARYSRYREDSLVGQVNARAGSGAWVPCDAEATALFDIADQLFRDSDGLFDITAGVLRRAWNFREPALPDPDHLAALRQHIGWQRVERQDGALRLPAAGMEIDIGGFGKEYAADRAAAVLAEAGMQHGYVNLGGDMRVIGPRPDGSPWTVGVQDPRQPGRVLASIPLLRGALATSGDYERYFELDGQRYCHILRPDTGYPVRYWRSVSIIAGTALQAGCMSTIAMLKQADALPWLKASGLTFLAIDSEGRAHSHTRH